MWAAVGESGAYAFFTQALIQEVDHRIASMPMPVYPGVRKRNTGITLLEVVAAIAVLAILATLAAPNFQNLIAQNRISALINDLSRDISVARTQAVSRGYTVAMCSSSNKDTCTGTPWQQGWIVWIDKNRDGARDPASEEIVRVSAAVPVTQATLTASGFDGSTVLAFASTGNLSVTSGSFKARSPDGKVVRCLILSPTGVGQIEKKEDLCP